MKNLIFTHGLYLPRSHLPTFQFPFSDPLEYSLLLTSWIVFQFIYANMRKLKCIFVLFFWFYTKYTMEAWFNMSTLVCLTGFDCLPYLTQNEAVSFQACCCPDKWNVTTVRSPCFMTAVAFSWTQSVAGERVWWGHLHSNNRTHLSQPSLFGPKQTSSKR